MNLHYQDPFEVPVLSDAGVRIRQRLKSVIAVGAVIAALGWVSSPLHFSESGAEGNSPHGIAPAEIPAMEQRVFHQGISHYHWNSECPLFNSQPQRTELKGKARTRIATSRHHAEKQNLHPCGLCRYGY